MNILKSEEMATLNDKEVGAIRLEKYKGTNIKTNYKCSICGKDWLVKPANVWHNKQKGHQRCVRGYIDPNPYINSIINNCNILSINGIKNGHYYLDVQCVLCHKKKSISSSAILKCGGGCCRKEVYNTIDIEQLFKQFYRNHNANCIQKELTTELSIEEYKALILRPCEYPDCDSIPYIKKENGIWSVKVNGVDRKDNSKSYLKNNVGTLCYHHNLIKSDYESKDLISWSKYLRD